MVHGKGEWNTTIRMLILTQIFVYIKKDFAEDCKTYKLKKDFAED